ncbi:MAG: hypothetical protein ACOC0J_01595 [Myxococcota bacterium]
MVTSAILVLSLSAGGAGADERASARGEEPSAPSFVPGGDIPAFLLHARLGVLVPNAALGPTGSAALGLQWRSSLHDRRLGLSLDAGWYPLSGEGSREDPEIGTYHFSWSAHAAPIHLGVMWEPVWLSSPSSFGAFFEGGLTGVMLFTRATLRNDSDHVFMRDGGGRGLALGLHAGAGLAFRAGPGEIQAMARWATALTDMGYPSTNPSPGDPGGLEILLGYRLGL